MIASKWICVLSFFVTGASFASGGTCAPYFGKGYCTDYIKDKVGHKPKGDAGAWSGTKGLKKSDIRAGDVAIFDIGSFGHVAYVEKVHKDKHGKVDKVTISEKNYGSPSNDPKELKCAVTKKFNIVTTRSISVDKISRVWRP